MRILLPLLLATVFLAGQTAPTPVKATYINGITSASTVIDNRSYYRQNDTHLFCSTGTGSWTVQLQYSDSSASGPWSSFSESSSVVTSASSSCAGYGRGYHSFLRFSVSGTVAINYTGLIGIYLPPGGGGGEGGSVSYVGLTVPSIFSVANSPVTSIGTFDVSLATQTANTVFAGPGSGSPAAPTFRVLMASDIPALPYENVLTFSPPLSRSVNTVTLPAASASLSGYLSSTDWSTFNGKENALTFSSPPFTRIGNTISMTAASASLNGYLTSTDWNTFAGKAGVGGCTAGLYVTATTLTTPSCAQVAYSQLSGLPTLRYQLVGVGGTSQTARGRVNLIAGTNVTITVADNSGSDSTDVTINASPGSGGYSTIQSNTSPVTQRTTVNFSTEFTVTDNSGAGRTDLSINSVAGSKISGDIAGNAANVNGTVAIAKGGTGQTTKAAAYDALSPNSTEGDVTYRGASNNVRLAGNTTSTRKFLRQTGTGSASAAPAWDTLSSGDVPNNASNTTGQSNTALALASDPANCSTGDVAAGITAAGVAEGCLTVSVPPSRVVVPYHATTMAPACTARASNTIFTITLTGNVSTFTAPSGCADGQKVTFEWTENSPGAYTVAYPAAFESYGAIDTASTKRTIQSFIYKSGTTSFVPQGPAAYTGTPLWTTAYTICSSGCSASTSISSGMTITAATHGQGLDPTMDCWTGSAPRTASSCAYTVATNGDIVMTYSTAPTKLKISGNGGAGSPGATGPAGTIQQLVNAQTGTSYTYLNGDASKLVTHTNGSAIAGTLPQANGSTFISGWFMDVQNRGVGTLTITPTTSTIDGASSLALTTGQGVRISSDGANYFTQRGMTGGAGGVCGSDGQFQYNSSGTCAGIGITTGVQVSGGNLGVDFSKVAGVDIANGYSNDNDFTLGKIIRGPELLTTGTDIVSSSTIAPTSAVHRVTGTVTTSTITPPAMCLTSSRSCVITLIPTGAWPVTTGGNIATAVTLTANRVYHFTYVHSVATWYLPN